MKKSRKKDTTTSNEPRKGTADDLKAIYDAFPKDPDKALDELFGGSSRNRSSIRQSFADCLGTLGPNSA